MVDEIIHKFPEYMLSEKPKINVGFSQNMGHFGPISSTTEAASSFNQQFLFLPSVILDCKVV